MTARFSSLPYFAKRVPRFAALSDLVTGCGIQEFEPYYHKNCLNT
jgi:hypothetical protein